eukprot:3577263-Amphidinium_carterae.2
MKPDIYPCARLHGFHNSIKLFPLLDSRSKCRHPTRDADRSLAQARLSMIGPMMALACECMPNCQKAFRSLRALESLCPNIAIAASLQSPCPGLPPQSQVQCSLPQQSKRQ